MDKIKWIFNWAFIKEEEILFIICVILILLMFLLSFIFVKKELKKLNYKKEIKNEK